MPRVGRASGLSWVTSPMKFGYAESQRREGFFCEDNRGLQDLANTKKARLPEQN
jgi:hypothetical protein